MKTMEEVLRSDSIKEGCKKYKELITKSVKGSFRRHHQNLYEVVALNTHIPIKFPFMLNKARLTLSLEFQ